MKRCGSDGRMQRLRQFMLALRRAGFRGLAALSVIVLGAALASSFSLAQTAQPNNNGLGQVIQNVLNQPGGLQQVLQGAPVSTGSATSPTVTVAPQVTPAATTIPIANGVPSLANAPSAMPSGPPQTRLEKIMSD